MIAMKFGIWHDSCAVVARENFCKYDTIQLIYNKTNRSWNGPLGGDECILQTTSPTPSPDQSVHPCSCMPMFAKKGYCFYGMREFAESRKSGHFVSHMSAKFRKRLTILHAPCMYLNLKYTLDVMKNTMYLEKWLNLTTLFMPLQKRFFILSNDRVLLKNYVSLNFKIRDLGWKVFLRESVCFSNIGTSMDVRFGRE